MIRRKTKQSEDVEMGAGETDKVKTLSAGSIRFQVDWHEKPYSNDFCKTQMEIIENRCKLKWIPEDNFTLVRIEMRVQRGVLKNCTFTFLAYFSHENYPYKPPFVHLSQFASSQLEPSCSDKIEHCSKIMQYLSPQEDQRVVIPMLGQEWKPILTLRQIVFTIELLLQEPPEKELYEP